MKDGPDVEKIGLTRKLISDRGQKESEHSIIDGKRAIDLAVKVMFMINCTSETTAVGGLELGQTPVWHDDSTLRQFMETILPRKIDSKWEEQPGVCSAIPARRLIRLGGLRMVLTSNIDEHLSIEDDTMMIFGHMPFLWEHLQVKSPVLPEQFLREHLASVQQVLFPLDPSSQSRLRSLSSKVGFGIKILDAPRVEHETSYMYLRQRLLDLYDEVQSPKPRGYLEKWFERRSGGRYVMMATFVGVIFAVILGMLSLGVSVFQAWVGYQQWKHPISN